MKRRITKALIWFFIVGLVALLIYNIAMSKDFFATSISTFATCGVAILVTYYLTQSKNEDRCTRETIVKVIDQIQSFITAPERVIFTEATDHRKLLLELRRWRSKIDILSSYAEQYDYSTECKEIRENFQYYHDFCDAHYQDLQHMQKSDMEIMRWMQNIDSRCDNIYLKLYPPENCRRGISKKR